MDLRKVISEVEYSVLERERGFTKRGVPEEFWRDRWFDEPTLTAVYRRCKGGYVYEVIRWRDWVLFRHWGTFTAVRRGRILWLTYGGWRTITTISRLRWILWEDDVACPHVSPGFRGLFVTHRLSGITARIEDVVYDYVRLDLSRPDLGVPDTVWLKAARIQRRKRWVADKILKLSKFNPAGMFRIGLAEASWRSVEETDKGVRIPFMFHMWRNTFYVNRWVAEQIDSGVFEFRGYVNRTLNGRHIGLLALVNTDRMGVVDCAIIGEEFGVWFTVHVPPLPQFLDLRTAERWAFQLDEEHYIYAQQ